MVRLMLAALALGLAAAWTWPAVEPQRKPHLLTAEHNEKTLPVRTGDEVVLKLPAQIPYWWVPLEKGGPKGLTALGEGKFEDMKPPEGQVPPLGAPKWYVVRYRVAAEPGTEIAADWIFCRFGRPTKGGVEGGEPLRPGDPIKPDQAPDEGMVFRVRLKVER
jgi:hypothetical protein